MLEDFVVPRALVMLSFAHLFGGIVILSIAQNVFLSRLASDWASKVPGMDSTAILSKNALGLVGAVPERFREQIMIAYNEALVQVLYIALGSTCVVITSSLGIEWRSVKGERGEGKDETEKGTKAGQRIEEEEKEGGEVEQADGKVVE